MELSTDLAIAYSAIVTMAIAPIYVGCHYALDQKGAETMSTEQAWKFPFIGSAVLFGLYVLFKVFSKEYINMLLTGYFLFLGILAVTATLKPLFMPLFAKPIVPKKFSWKLPFWNEPFEVEVDKVDLFAGIFGTAVGVWYLMTKHWISNNILGLAFSIQGIAMLSLSSYKVGAILLGGLFIYDIFWVFGTDVMVTVAKSFDAPIKLLFPKQLFAEELQFSMLGLGDIVIPGVFIALMLRFDVKMAAASKKPLSKTYFWFTYVAYFFGLVTTIVVMHTFKSAQPALLYLVPACLGSSILLSIIRGEMSTLLSFEEEEKKTEEKKEN